MASTLLILRAAEDADFDELYGLCERTMRAYVEADFGDCFEQLARPTLRRLLQRGLFSWIVVDGAGVGAMACEQHPTHLQLEELYIEPARQNQGLGTEVVSRIVAKANVLALPVRLHVLASNPARVLYQRLGFSITRSAPGVHYLEHRPPPA